MRAWLLLVIVLATFQTIVQVASTEDNNISSALITAIQPVKNQFNTNSKNIKMYIKNIEETEQINDLENEVIEVKNFKNLDKKQNNKNHNNKMALKESEIEQQQQQKPKQNQKTAQQIQNHTLEDATKLHQQKSSSTSHHNRHHQHHQHHRHHLKQHRHRQHKSQPATQQQQQNTSDNLTSTTTASSSSLSTLSSSSSRTSQTPQYSKEAEEDASSSFSSSSSSSSTIIDGLDVSISENDDGAISVESQQPQMEAVIPDEGPPTFSNQEIIGERAKPDPATLDQFKISLLPQLNMTEPPKKDRPKNFIQEVKRQLHAQMMGHELNSVKIPKSGFLTKSANTVRSFIHQDSKDNDWFPHYHQFRVRFNINGIPAAEKLKAAALLLTRDDISHNVLNPRIANRTRYQVLVYDITRVGVRGKREPIYLLLDNKTIRLNSTDTVSLDVHPAVDRWLATPKKNFGLLVEVRTSRSLKPAPQHHVRLRRSADKDHENWQHKQPLLRTYTDDGRHKQRSIRNGSTRSKKKGDEEICKLHPLYVDFDDVGWNGWVVGPPGYDAFVCRGSCPFTIAEHLNSTNHAVVQTLVNSINPGKVPKPCCVPTQYEGIDLLINKNGIILREHYRDMVVTACGCQ